MCVILSATVNLFCLFMPKMYIVLLHPEKYARGSPSDRRATTRATSSAILKGAADSVRNVILSLHLFANLG